jgi:hypothetical protein
MACSSLLHDATDFSVTALLYQWNFSLASSQFAEVGEFKQLQKSLRSFPRRPKHQLSQSALIAAMS